MQENLAVEGAGAPPTQRLHFHQKVPAQVLPLLPGLLLQAGRDPDQVHRVRVPQRERGSGNIHDRQDLRVRSG